MPNQISLKPLDGYKKMSDGDVVKAGIGIVTNLTGNPKFTNPPVDLAVLKTDVDQLSQLIAEAADGSKKVIARKNQQRRTCIGLYRILARWVEVTCDGDVAAFQTSGFQPASTTRVKPAPLSEKIRKIERGANSGQIAVWIQPFPKAISYEIRFAAAGPNNTAPTTWTNQPVGIVKAPAVVTGLTPGTNYLFQARALLKDRMTDWTDSVGFICA